jgi:ABC-type bacteriocin/lantibiotic exporter with double-glycine peptidase domain
MVDPMSPDDLFRRRKIRWRQFSLRTLLIAATILGPLLGWYGPATVTWLQALMTNYSSQPASLGQLLTANSVQRQRIIQKQRTVQQLQAIQQQRLTSRNLRIQQILDAQEERERDLRMRSGRYPLVNSNGTFNMRYHLRDDDE